MASDCTRREFLATSSALGVREGTSFEQKLVEISITPPSTVPPEPRTWKNSLSGNSQALTVCATMATGPLR